MIEEYRFGHIRIDGQSYTSDVIVYPDRVDASWWRKEGHRLSLEDMADALAAGPDVVVVGTGAHGVMRVGEDVQRRLSELGIELRAARTDEACRFFNELATEKRTVALLHLTC